jgi:hypothetical protein
MIQLRDRPTMNMGCFYTYPLATSTVDIRCQKNVDAHNWHTVDYTTPLPTHKLEDERRKDPRAVVEGEYLL